MPMPYIEKELRLRRGDMYERGSFPFQEVPGPCIIIKAR